MIVIIYKTKIKNSEFTQSVDLNILRSRGSPVSCPSISVREWQVAMATTSASSTLNFEISGSTLHSLKRKGSESALSLHPPGNLRKESIEIQNYLRICSILLVNDI